MWHVQKVASTHEGMESADTTVPKQATPVENRNFAWQTSGQTKLPPLGCKRLPLQAGKPLGKLPWLPNDGPQRSRLWEQPEPIKAFEHSSTAPHCLSVLAGGLVWSLAGLAPCSLLLPWLSPLFHLLCFTVPRCRALLAAAIGAALARTSTCAAYRWMLLGFLRPWPPFFSLLCLTFYPSPSPHTLIHQ